MTTLPLLRRPSLAYSLACRSYHTLQTRVRVGSFLAVCRVESRNGNETYLNANANRTFGHPTNISKHPVHVDFISRPFSTTRSRRRRRRGGGDISQPSVGDASEEDEGETLVHASKPSAIINDPSIFEEAARAFLNRAVEALEPMKAQNEVMKMTRSYTEQGEKLVVSFKPGDGKYILQVDVDVGTLSLTSPMSGNHVYVLCAYTGQFLGMNDGHVCEGMIVRDMIRHCNGMPQF